MRDEIIRTFRSRRQGGRAIRAAVLMLGAASILTLTGCWTSPSSRYSMIMQFSMEGDTWLRWFSSVSTRPFYFESDVVFLPELLGIWNEKKRGIGAIFETNDERSYRITFTGEKGQIDVEGLLVRLEDKLFLVVSLGEKFSSIGHIRIEAGALRMATPRPCREDCKDEIRMGYLKIKKTDFSKENPDFIHRMELVVGSRKKLRKHFIDMADEYFSFENGDILRRVSQPE